MTSKRLVELSIIKFVKKNESQVTFQSLNLPRTKVIIDLDASFNNFHNGNNQGRGHIHANR